MNAYLNVCHTRGVHAIAHVRAPIQRMLRNGDMASISCSPVRLGVHGLPLVSRRSHRCLFSLQLFAYRQPSCCSSCLAFLRRRVFHFHINEVIRDK